MMTLRTHSLFRGASACRPRGLVHFLLGLVLLAYAGAANAQTIQPPYATNYTFHNIGSASGLPGGYGGLTFLYNDPNTLLIGGSADSASGGIYAIKVARGSNNHITGFSGSASLVATAPDIDGGLIYGPNNILFFTQIPDNAIGEIPSGSTSPSYYADLYAQSVSPSVGSLMIVPTGFGGAGHVKITSYNANAWYDSTLFDNGDGTYDFTTSGIIVTVVKGPEGIAFVPAGSPNFPFNSVLVVGGYAGRIVAYQTDSNGDPVTTTAQDFMINLNAPLGAAFDPTTGDLLFSLTNSNQILVVSGFTTTGGGGGGGGSTPTLKSISPASQNAGAPGFTLIAKGSNFDQTSVVHWTGSSNAALTTTYVSSTELKAAVPASLIASPGTAQVNVVNSGAKASGSKPFKILLTTLKLASASVTKNSNGTFSATVSIKNIGYKTAPSAQITKSSLGAAATSTSLPVSLGSLAAGASGSAILTYPASAGTSGSIVLLKVTATFTGGAFSGSLKVTLP